jgi:membrane-associated phospholipid phosphatase
MALGCAVFAMVAWGVFATGRLLPFDDAFSLRVHLAARPALVQAMRIVSLMGYEGVIVLAVALGLWYISRWHWRRVALLALALGGGALLNLLLKLAFGRPRPVLPDPFVTLESLSFPSGHAMVSTIFYGLAGWLLWRRAAARWQRRLAALGAVGMIIAVGASRVYLGAHYLTDVLAGFAAGAAWLAFAILAVEGVG